MDVKYVEIYFIGLICLISTDEDRDKKTHAAVILAEDHEPTLFIGARDPSQLLTDPIVLKSGDRLKVEPSGTAIRDNLFAELVPPLNNLVNGKLDFRVQTRRALDEAIYLPLPKGTLRVAKNFENSAFYTLGGTTRGYSCVAYMSWLETKLDSVKITIYREGLQLGPYDAKTWVLLRNVESPNAPSYNHLIYYRYISEGSSASASISTVKEGCKAIEVTHGNYTKEAFDQKGRDIDVECVSSQWP